MKNLYTLALSMLFTFAAMAQPTLEYPQNAPEIGDITDIQFVSPDGLSTTPVGPNVTWDFSQLTNLYAGSIDAIDPTEAPAGSLFPQANIALRMNDTTYTYGLVDNTGFYYLGAQLTYAGIPITMVYSDSRKYLEYPFTYLDTYIDGYKGVSSVMFNEVRATGESLVIADSYGSLILPDGTYNDVLRISTIDVETDSIFIKNTFISEVITTREQFHWFAQNSVSPLFSIEIIQAAGTTDTVAYYATTGASVGDLKGPISQLSVFPNPAKDKLVVSFESAQNVNASVSIVNQLGQLMISSKIPDGTQGRVNHNIDVSTLPPGIYFANVGCSCGKQLTEKFVIR